MYVNEHIFQTVRTSTNIRADGIMNHIASIFNPQPVQGQRVLDAAGPAVEVAREARADAPLLPRPSQSTLVPQASRDDAPARGAPVPQQAQLVHHAQGSRGVQVRPVQESVRARQDSVFKNFLVKKPHPGFMKTTTPSNWFSSDFHLKVRVSASSSPSPASVSAPSSSSAMSLGAASANLLCDGSQEQGESLSDCNVESRNKIIS